MPGFGACLPDVGLMDMLRFHQFSVGPYTFSGMGGGIYVETNHFSMPNEIAAKLRRAPRTVERKLHVIRALWERDCPISKSSLSDP